MKKLIDVGLITMRNEAEDIRGWAKESLFFCKKVVAVIDPETTDSTEAILSVEFPEIIIEYQDRTLGDSDDENQGATKQMICHANYTRAIHRHAQPGDWIMEMAPDERLVPAEFEMILHDLKIAQSEGYDGMLFPHYYTPRGDLNHVIDWYTYFCWGALKQIKFWKLREGYFKNIPPHSDQINFCKKLYPTYAGFYHFCYVKNSRKAFGGWRDNPRYADFEVIPHTNPFPNWRTIPELNNKGEFI